MYRAWGVSVPRALCSSPAATPVVRAHESVSAVDSGSDQGAGTFGQDVQPNGHGGDRHRDEKGGSGPLLLRTVVFVFWGQLSVFSYRLT